MKAAAENQGATLFDSKKTGGQKRKRNTNYDPSDVDGYTGPWARYTDEKSVAVPDAELQKEMDEIVKKVCFVLPNVIAFQRQMKSRKFRQQQKESEGVSEETTQLHCMYLRFFSRINFSERDDGLPRTFLPCATCVHWSQSTTRLYT